MSEHAEQVLVANWAAAMQDVYPDLRWLHAVPNGGKRSPKTGRDLKAEGVKRGVPDLHLPVARGGYIGCWVEMKCGKGRPTPEQLEWIAGLQKLGHFVTVCWTHEEAEDTLEHYILGHIVREP